MSSTSSMPLWGQAWELVVTYTNSDGKPAPPVVVTSNAWEPEALRMTFDVLKAANSAPLWYADISIYNMDSQAAQAIVQGMTLPGGVWATLSAGFQFGPNKSSIIWDGPVFQTLFTREAVVDQKLTLHCVAFPNSANLLPQAFSIGGPLATQQQLVAKLIAGANLPPVSVTQGTQGTIAAQRMAAVQYPRGNTVFGTVSKYTNQIADSNGLQTWFDGKQAYIAEPDNGMRTPSLIYAPPSPPGGDPRASLPDGVTQSIIGTPEQTPEGVNFTVLLDPRLQVGLPPLLVQLVRTQITQLTITSALDSTLPSPLTSNLIFFVKQIRHTGDTRGNDWQTEVTGWSTAYANTLPNFLSGGAS